MKSLEFVALAAQARYVVAGPDVAFVQRGDRQVIHQFGGYDLWTWDGSEIIPVRWDVSFVEAVQYPRGAE